MINFVNSLWVSCHVIMGFFEATDTSRAAMVVKVKDLLSSKNLLDKLITYVKEVGDSLSTTLTQPFILIVSCGLLGFAIP